MGEEDDFSYNFNMTDYNPADIAHINVNDLLMGYNNKTEEMWGFTDIHVDLIVTPETIL